MSLMRGKFYVYGSREGVEINIGRDFPDPACMLLKCDGTDPQCEYAEYYHQPADDPALLTGNSHPISVTIPYDVMDVLAARYLYRALAEEKHPKRVLRKMLHKSHRWEAK